MSGYSEKTIHIAQFFGKKLDWQMWSKQFLVISGRKQYKDVLTGKTAVPAATTVCADEDVGITKALITISFS